MGVCGRDWTGGTYCGLEKMLKDERSVSATSSTAGLLGSRRRTWNRIVRWSLSWSSQNDSRRGSRPS